MNESSLSAGCKKNETIDEQFENLRLTITVLQSLLYKFTTPASLSEYYNVMMCTKSCSCQHRYLIILNL